METTRTEKGARLLASLVVVSVCLPLRRDVMLDASWLKFGSGRVGKGPAAAEPSEQGLIHLPDNVSDVVNVVSVVS
jgi:hypothetical protein